MLPLLPLRQLSLRLLLLVCVVWAQVALGLGVTLLAIGYVGQLAKGALEEAEKESDMEEEEEGEAAASSSSRKSQNGNGNGASHANGQGSSNGNGNGKGKPSSR